jgi:hypothetical protein
VRDRFPLDGYECALVCYAPDSGEPKRGIGYRLNGNWKNSGFCAGAVRCPGMARTSSFPVQPFNGRALPRRYSAPTSGCEERENLWGLLQYVMSDPNTGIPRPLLDLCTWRVRGHTIPLIRLGG